MIIYILSLRHAQIAQLVEQWTENPRVTGSIPVLGTFFMPKNSIKQHREGDSRFANAVVIVRVRMHGAISFWKKQEN